MADTTQAQVLAIAPELAGVAAEAWAVVLADVALQVTEKVYGVKQELAQRYLAAHRLTLIARSDKGGEVTSERTGDVSTSYAAAGAGDYSETVYGREFERIRRGTVSGFMTVTP
jgi:hypothetical protein